MTTPIEEAHPDNTPVDGQARLGATRRARDAATFDGECSRTAAVDSACDGGAGGASLRVEKYDASLSRAWNDFLVDAKSATFLFHRGFLEYHADRFADCSLMVYEGEELLALLPANLNGNELVSHGGLTYGGLIVRRSASLGEISLSFRAVLAWASANGIPKLAYKRIPRIYSGIPDDEVDYLLFLVGAELFRRDLSTAIAIGTGSLPYKDERRRTVASGARRGCRIEAETGFEAFWRDVLTPTLLERHGVAPVHAVEEIMLLAARFPANIKQYNVVHDGEVIAGATMFLTDTVAHMQYLASTPEGRRLRALDFLIDDLLRNHTSKIRYFDFGISNEERGRLVNVGLHRWKEGFGARGVIHDFYKVETANYTAIDAAFGSTQRRCQ